MRRTTISAMLAGAIAVAALIARPDDPVRRVALSPRPPSSSPSSSSSTSLAPSVQPPQSSTAPSPGKPPSASSAPTSPSGEPSLAGPLAASEPEIRAFVERSRGLRFLRPVRVEALSSAAFDDRAMASIDAQQAEDAEDAEEERSFEDEIAVLRALGLVGAEFDPEGGGGGGHLGFYDDAEKTVVVRGRYATATTRAVLAHELAHALADQHTPLESLREDDFDASLAFRALVEGDAMVVENDYVDQELTEDEADRLELDDPFSRLLSANDQAPRALLDLAAFPYESGERFVRRLKESGGQQALDAAFRKPPTTTEQILHPEKYLAGEGAKAVAAPRAPRGKIIDSGTLGELGLFLALRSSIGAPLARRASRGWGGDSFIAWTDAGASHVILLVRMDSTTEQTELVRLLQRPLSGRKPIPHSVEGALVVLRFDS